MDNDEIKLLLVRYITGQADEEETQQVKAWLSLHPENEQYFIELYELWQNMLYTRLGVVDDELAYRNFVDRVSPEKPARKRVWLKAAAALLLAVGVSIPFIIHQHAAVGQQVVNVVSKKGAIKKLQLSDGTIVWLNAGSQISYSAGYGKTDRAIRLEGEAFFEIAPGKKNIPFSVTTSRFIIRDIGTKFNVKAYPNDPFFETTVEKGEVSVENKANTADVNRIYVKPSQVLKIFYRHDGKDLGVHAMELSPEKTYNEMQVVQLGPEKINVYDGWKDDLLVFDGATLDHIARVLERRYDVQISLKDSSLKRIQYNGSFKGIGSINKVLDIIKTNTPISYSITDKQVTISKSTN